MDEETTGRSGSYRLRSVRVRITLAAVLVTTVALSGAGWLLIRSMEDNQVAEMRAEGEAQLDVLVGRLAAGEDPHPALLETMPFSFVSLAYDDPEMFIGGPVLLAGRDKIAVPLMTDEATPAEVQRGVLIQVDGGTVSRGSGTVPDPSILQGAAGGVAPGGAGEPTDARGSGPPQTAEPGIQPGGQPLPDVDVLGPEDVSPYPLESVTRQVWTPNGDLTATVYLPVDGVARSVDAVLQLLLVGLPILTVLVAWVAWQLVGRALRPVEAIRVEAEAIGGRTLHRRVPDPATGDEVGRLAGTMNAMLGRLESSARHQRQFVADASHELRSPLAAIRTDLEVALHEGDDADWPTVAKAVLAEEGRLEDLLHDLLVLAAEDEGAVTIPGGPVDLVDVAADEAVRGRGRAVPVQLTDAAPADAAPPMQVTGVRGQLQRAVGNLVDNAARHADSTVRVTVTPTDGGRVQLAVDDDGPGIPPADRERVFDRFTRLDTSRTRHQGGSGLGLAVVRSIVTRHGGWVWSADSPLGGARFVIDLPVRALN